VGYAAASADVSSIAALQVHVGRLLADTLLLENSPRRSMTASRLILVALRLIEAGDHERRLDAIEERLNAMEGVR
jgi:hypothetical protein